MFGTFQFGRSQFGQSADFVATEPVVEIPFIGDAGGWPGPIGWRRKRFVHPLEPPEHLTTRKAAAVEFYGWSTLIGTLSARVSVKVRFTRSNVMTARFRARACIRAKWIHAERSAFHLIGKSNIATRGPVSIRTHLSGVSGSRMKCFGIENPPEDIFLILNGNNSP